MKEIWEKSASLCLFLMAEILAYLYTLAEVDQHY